jgi:flagellar basal-body rod protein FlgF
MPDILGIAEAGMRSSLRQLDAISNNMANVNTQGYKREIAVQRAFAQHLLGAEPNAPVLSAEAESPVGGQRDFAAGPLKYTGSGLSAALEGRGFFQVQSPQGVLLTRNGQFRIDDRGQLVNAQGWPVLLQGATTFDDGDFTLRRDGSVVVAGEVRTRLDVVDAEPEQLETVAPDLFRSAATAPLADGDIHIRQGYLEGSNVDALTEMVKLMGVTRHIEASQQVLRAYDEVLESAITNLGQF